MQSTPRLLTIGHSNHPIDRFLDLLRLFSVEVVVDTRSHPHSNFSPQFDRAPLDAALRDAGIRYVYLGRELGGRPQDPASYDDKGHVLYDKVAESTAFRAAIARLQAGIERHRVALLCAEENPAECHRRLLVGRVLASQGVIIEHIRGDGTLQPESELAMDGGDTNQMSLFQEVEASPWRSTQSVSPKKRRSNSSAF